MCSNIASPRPKRWPPLEDLARASLVARKGLDMPTHILSLILAEQSFASGSLLSCSMHLFIASCPTAYVVWPMILLPVACTAYGSWAHGPLAYGPLAYNPLAYGPQAYGPLAYDLQLTAYGLWSMTYS